MRQIPHLNTETLTTEFYSLVNDLDLKIPSQEDEVMGNLAVDVMITAVTIELNHGADVFNIFQEEDMSNKMVIFIYVQASRLYNTFSTLLRSVFQYDDTLDEEFITEMLKEMYQ